MTFEGSFAGFFLILALSQLDYFDESANERRGNLDKRVTLEY